MTHPLDALSGNVIERDYAAELDQAVHRLEQVQESMANLELSREDAGWDLLTQQGKQDMSRAGIIRHAEQHRVMVIANPLIRRGSYLTAAYVFGQGVGTTVKGDKPNALCQGFLDDPVVRRVFSGAAAQEQNQVALGTDGNIFFALPTDRETGETTIREIPMDEISEIITAPGDRQNIRYYLRRWAELNPQTGRWEQKKALYPELRYMPLTQQRRVQLSPTESAPVQWNVPVYHMAPNRLKGQQWGTADVFSAIPWARGYSDFLNDWARLVKALSRIAFRVTSKGKPSQSNQARREAARLSEMPAGSTVAMGPGMDMEPMPKTGATIDSESARPLATMVAAAFGFSVTTLLSDPGATGARAVAETLNLPTRLSMEARQEVWREARRQILEYVMLQAARAPRGALRREAKVVRTGDRLSLVFNNQEHGTLDISFPKLDETPVETLVKALVDADSVGKVPPLVILERLLRAIGVRDVDEVLSSVKDEDGNFIPPDTQAGQAAGQAAADAIRRGQDPAQYL